MTEISVTIKYGKGYEESWAVFRGDTTREVHIAIGSYFGLDPANTDSLTLHELVTNVTGIAHGTAAAAAGLGAVAIPSQQVTNVTNVAPAPPAQSEGGSAWDTPAPEGDNFANPVLDRIAACASVDDLKVIWADNQAAFEDAEVMEAWKARGRELKAAA